MKPRKNLMKKDTSHSFDLIADDSSDGNYEDDDGLELDESFLDFLNRYKKPALASEILLNFLKKNNLGPEDFHDTKKMRRIDDTELYAELDRLELA